jgi:hypothetical protein
LLFEWPPFSKDAFILMFEASYILAFFGASILLAAAAAWWNIVRRPDREVLVRGVVQDSGREKSVAIASVIALGVSAVAALLAIVGWFS